MHKNQSVPRFPARRFNLPALAFSLFAFFLVCASASAQLSGKGQITGRVADSSGAAIPDAAITITNDVTGITATTKSTGDGDYTVSTLDPGVYTITVTVNGFQKLTQKNVHVNALESQTVNTTLTIGAETQTVTVDAQPPQLETSNATLGATMENEMYSALPLQMGAYGQPDQRRATDFVFLMPGVQANNTNGNATTNAGIVNGSGSRGAVSGIYIDGVVFVRAGGNGDPRYVWTAISVDAVDQFQVQTNGYSAIYEGQGIQNYTIKQGSPKYHGSIYEFFRNEALNTWGFFGPSLARKPIERSNEYGIVLSGPLVPFGPLRDKLFFFGNYNGFRFLTQNPTAITFPTAAQQAGNFQGVQTGGIFDPGTQAACTALSTDGPCRYRYGQGPGVGSGSRGNPVSLCPANPTGCLDIIPSSQFSAIALKMQSFLPASCAQTNCTNLIGTGLQNNFTGPNVTKLTNFSTTDRVDFAVSQKHVLSFVGAVGRQASAVPQGQTTAGRNIGPLPYNYGQAFTPKTAVGVIEDVYAFTPHLTNQLKYGYARYDGPTINADEVPAFSAKALGITNTPAGQASTAFPITSFAGTNGPTTFDGATGSRVIAQNYTLLDNVQYIFRNHNITGGAQIAWLNYENIPASGGSSQLTLANAVTETAAINKSSNASPAYAVTAATGLSYASFLIGQIDKTSFTQYTVQEFGSRFRAISPYVQDNWKVSQKLTLDLGLRFDYFPPMRENKDNQSFYSTTLANPVTGITGALQFAGTGPNTCNCSSPSSAYKKNFGPRIGFAYQLDPKTVVRGSYGVMFTHGNGVGGGTASVTGGASNSLGFSASPSFAASGQLLSTAPFTGANGAIPNFTAATGRASGPAFGTGYTTIAGYTGTPSTIGYYDPYLGSRAPEYINFSLGFQHEWTPAIVTTMSYVGSQGHFLIADSSNRRGFYADQLDPKYLTLGSNLSSTGTTLTNYCAANAGVCPAYTNIFNTSQALSRLLLPNPFITTTDFFANTSNSNYHALQIVTNMRASHHLTFMANYTWSRAIDDGGTFRSGYALPAGSVANNPRAYAQDAIERTVSTSSQPHKVVLTAVYDLPFGRDVLASHAWERAAFGGFKLSTIFQAYSGSPLPVTGATCGTNPAQGTCMPIYNPAYTSNTARINGRHWGQGVTRTNFNTVSFIDSTAFANAPNYQFGNTSRTAPYGLTGPGNYNWDLGLVRAFKLHFTEAAKFDLRAELYNVTNHTQFNVASVVFGNASFGQVSGTQANLRRSAQFSARVSF